MDEVVLFQFRNIAKLNSILSGDDLRTVITALITSWLGIVTAWHKSGSLSPSEGGSEQQPDS